MKISITNVYIYYKAPIVLYQVYNYIHIRLINTPDILRLMSFTVPCSYREDAVFNKWNLKKESLPSLTLSIPE